MLVRNEVSPPSQRLAEKLHVHHVQRLSDEHLVGFALSCKPPPLLHSPTCTRIPDCQSCALENRPLSPGYTHVFSPHLQYSDLKPSRKIAQRFSCRTRVLCKCRPSMQDAKLLASAEGGHGTANLSLLSSQPLGLHMPRFYNLLNVSALHSPGLGAKELSLLQSSKEPHLKPYFQ